LLPVGKRHLFEGNDGVVAGAVDQDIDSASLGADRIGKTAHVVLFGNVSLDGNKPVLGVPCFQQVLEGIRTVVDREYGVSVGKETVNNL
jgi:hypothetical protein